MNLQCTRNVFAREHPLAIFESVFRAAAARECPPPDCPWFFHPLQRTGDRIRAGREYPLAVIFPTSDSDLVSAFAERLAAHLAKPVNNFSLVQAHPPETRSLSQLEFETAALDSCEDEICLDFLTPFAFRPPDSKRRWLLSAEALLTGLARRVERLWGLHLDLPPELVTKVRALSCYWRYVEFRHASKSSTGTELLNGCVGPLYLQGEVRPWLPLLRLGMEAHAGAVDGHGHRLAFGAGAYQLHARHPFFTGALLNPQVWSQHLEELAAENPEPDPLLHALSKDESLAELIEQLRQNRWEPEPARGFRIDKPIESKTRVKAASGNSGPSAAVVQPPIKSHETAPAPETVPYRVIAELSARDRLVHRVLHRLLAPVLDRLFEANSIGFRPGHSTADARRAVAAHVRAGCAWVVETDVANFFDTVDWELLDAALDSALPRADQLVRQLVRRAVRTPLLLEGRPVPRTRGLLQGSALSPLLANLFLDPLDEAAAAAGLRLIRYADDLLLLCRDEAEAVSSLQKLRALLAPLKLELNEDKTAITPVAAGFSFLGYTFAPELTEDFLERTTLRKPIHVASDYAFLGVEEDTLVLRRDGVLVGRLPLRRAAELIIHGPHAISTPLLQRCAERGIPVAFCTVAGFHAATLRPDSRSHFELSGRHWVRFCNLTPSEMLAQAREIVAARLANYLAWMRECTGYAALARHLDETLARLDSAENVEALRGMEGEAARLLFRWVNDRVMDEHFRSRRREPRTKADIWNSLLDFAYTRLFTHLNVLLRTRGLNPYLGFLHSAADNYESLVCDLQEPFRARCDRWALRLVNRRQVAPTDFAPHPYGGLRLTSEAIRRLIHEWEREMDTRWATDAGTLEQLLHAQVEALREWALGADRLRLYRAHTNRPAPISPSPPATEAGTGELVKPPFGSAIRAPEPPRPT